jgi:hypothetical protein
VLLTAAVVAFRWIPGGPFRRPDHAGEPGDAAEHVPEPAGI